MQPFVNTVTTFPIQTIGLAIGQPTPAEPHQDSGYVVGTKLAGVEKTGQACMEREMTKNRNFSLTDNPV